VSYSVFTQPYHTDSCSTYYGNAVYCGTKTYWTSHSWLSIGSTSPTAGVPVVVSSHDPAIVGTYTVTVYVQFYSYTGSSSQSFSIQL
jgi:hypothetical protein